MKKINSEYDDLTVVSGIKELNRLIKIVRILEVKFQETNIINREYISMKQCDEALDVLRSHIEEPAFKKYESIAEVYALSCWVNHRISELEAMRSELVKMKRSNISDPQETIDIPPITSVTIYKECCEKI